jgi:hypothetical protein
MSSSIIYLSDCTPLYTALGAPSRIPVVSGSPLQRSARLEWTVPPNTENIPVDSYIVRYKLTGAPLSQTLNEVISFFPSIIIAGLSNGVSYDFWVIAKNRFGESPHSPTISVIPGAAPSAGQLVRRAYHSTVGGTGLDVGTPQKVGIEFTPPLEQNGAPALIFMVKYTLMNESGAMTDVSYTETYSVQANERMLDVSGLSAIVTTGAKGNYIRKEIVPPTNASPPAAFQSGNYRFQVFSRNIYGTSAAPDLSFAIYLYSTIDANDNAIARFTSPSFASYSNPSNGDISGVLPDDSRFRFTWKQYRGSGTGSSGATAYAGWMYRIQYTDDKDNWYYPPSLVSAPYTAKFPEYTRAYDTTSAGADSANFEYSIDISRNIVNGRRYYVRYCVVSALGDTSEYTQVTDTNLSLVSCIPGKSPIPPPIFRASSTNHLVRLYFDWIIRPPSLELTGGLPILNYRIDRYVVERTADGRNPTIIPNSLTILDNVQGPYYEDGFGVRNGIEYEYRVYSRNAFGISTTFTSVGAVPSRPSDVVRNVTASIDSSQITLIWNQPEVLEPEMPIVQYYVEYREYNIFDVSDIPLGNIVGPLSSPMTISNTVQDMNSILVDDALWAKLTTTVVGAFTNSINLSYTVRDLINNKPFVFRISAVTQDRARRKIIGLAEVIGSNTPYLQRPVIIGRVPRRLSNVEYMNADSAVNIKWTSTDINNTEDRILRFIVDYDIATDNSVHVYSQRQTFDYLNSVVFNDGSTTVNFSVVVTGLENNVTQRPDSRTNSYVMRIYAESSIGLTNEESKVKLQDLSYTDIFEGISVTRVVRPRTTPSVISEIRT